MMFAEIAAPPERSTNLLEESAPASASVRILHPDGFCSGGRGRIVLVPRGLRRRSLLEQRWNERGAVIDFAFEGDLVGLGFLTTHACRARALVETRLTCLPLEAQSSAIGNNPKSQLKLDEAIEREFEYRRACLVESSEQSPLKRVAAFLVSLSRINAHEAEILSWWATNVRCGFIADLLGMSVETLGNFLIELEELGLIQACFLPAGVRLKDIAALEELASQPGVPDLSARLPRGKGRLH